MSEIEAGGTYSDGKIGRRLVVDVSHRNPKDPKVKYRLLGGLRTTKYDYVTRKTINLIDQETEVALSTFATWAKERIS